MSDNKALLTATVSVVDDATTPLGKVADALRKTGATEEQVNQQIAESQLVVEMAQKGRLSTSDQLKFAMQAEAAKGNELATELVTLERDYAILVKQMQAMARYGAEIPQGMISQANAARKAADAIKEHTDQSTAYDKIGDKLAQKFSAQNLAVKVVTEAYAEAKEAISLYATKMVDAAKPLEDLGREATATEKAMVNLKTVWADPEWDKQGDTVKVMATVYAAFNTELAEAEARVAARNKLVAAAKQDQAAVNAMIDEETAKIKGNDEVKQKTADGLKKLHAIEKTQEQDRKAFRAQAHAQEIDEWVAAEEFRIAREKELGDRAFNEKKALNDKLSDDIVKGVMRTLAAEEKADDARRKSSAKLRQDFFKNAEAEAQTMAATASSVVQVWGQAGAAIASGQKSAGEAGRDAAIQTAQTVIMTAAASAAAKQMEAHAFIPFVGIAIGAAAAAAIFGVIQGYLTKFHTGGVVGSNDGQRLPGMASNERAITVQVGERVVTPRQQSGGGGGVVINARSLFAPTAADTKRMVNQVSKLQRRQRRLGYA